MRSWNGWPLNNDRGEKEYIFNDIHQIVYKVLV